MRDRVLAYAFIASLCVHLALLGVVGKTSASKPIDPESLKIVKVEMVDLTSQPEPTPTTEVQQPEPRRAPTPRIAIPRRLFDTIIRRPRAESPRPEPRPSTAGPRPPVTGPVGTRPTRNTGDRPAGNPGGPLDLGPPTRHGTDVGPGGRTPVGWVPGDDHGTGAGSGSGPGTGRPDPVPDAGDGPGTKPAPPPPPPPPPPPDVEAKVCAESGMLPGPNCERTITKSFRPGSVPDSRCTACKPKHVSTLADRAEPELISGRTQPKYPESAVDQGLEGSVKIEYTINTEGNVVGAKVVSSSGYSALDRAALEAVQSRRYKPAVQGGIPRNYRKRETFHFRLN